MDNMVRKVTVYVVTAELGEISVQVCYESLLSPSTFTHTHTEQTTQPLVMHSFVTSNPLPLGYETQHRMSERERQRQRQRILKERESFLCVEEDTFHIYAVKEKRDGRK